MTGDVFNPEQLSRCISCGFCLPACPTYAMTGDEASSPRGRITLMRALQDGTLPPDDATLAEQSSFCLGCRACEPVCPAGVEYGDLLEQWRVHQWRGWRRPLVARALMLLVEQRWLLRLLGLVRRAARGQGVSGSAADEPGAQLMLGCVERGLFPAVSRAAQSLAPELAVPTAQGCCGALHAHNGDLAGGERLAERLGEDLPGTIVTTSGGCAAHLASVLGRDRVRELSTWIAGRPAGAELRVAGRRARVALQDSCHLRNGLSVFAEPRALLRQVADYVELPSAATCCGAAGTYSLLRAKDSRRILDAKLDEIEAAGVDLVVAVNPGCLRQLRTGLRRRRSAVRAVHLAELLTRVESP
ncbi:(Fe-S)-binding protein [Micromonospora peucetia]|uniref:Glycolate oxidase iron-sulfur subunit n=1 Tax=Micromonospora peucetia TaxID=47871 RepID=A0A1C6VXU5_9ACTN|nr:(Fe-S)-binding protein [Micromonospora peucetia]MCX4390576.1 (Fe-S)-binding protein [Micromonospora peucetia]WSA31515.1 (Fe-S)-binding protein [Micromonospora peucetia]SCL71138.1 glycolate oxidase iron-sulfur subunit [Micromonospora peucetia]